MRVRYLRVGRTYLVEVPHELPRDRWPSEPWDPAMWQRLLLLRSTRFPLTLTALDQDDRMATGEHLINQSSASVPLHEDQVDELGLLPGRYWIRGMLQDESGRPVSVPAIEELRVPTWWLHPLTAERPPSHRDLRWS